MRDSAKAPTRLSTKGDEDYRPGFMELIVSDTLGAVQPRPKLKVSITVSPRFTLLAFSAFVDALRIASDIGDRSQPRHCSWTLVGPHTRPVTSSCGAEISHWECFGDPSRFDYVVIVGGLLREEDGDPRLLNYLRQAAAANVKIIGICTGVFAMAEAGVMAGYRCLRSRVPCRRFQGKIFPSSRASATKFSSSTETASPAREASRPSIWWVICSSATAV